MGTTGSHGAVRFIGQNMFTPESKKGLKNVSENGFKNVSKNGPILETIFCLLFKLSIDKCWPPQTMSKNGLTFGSQK